MKTIVHLHNNDNVAISIKSISSGDIITLETNQFKAIDTILFGHKIAITPIKEGTKIYKYGVPIGIATKDIEKGSHVHTHNIKSLYMAQYTNPE